MTEKTTAAEYRKKKPAKYRNVKVTFMGINFDSKKEASRYSTLILLKTSGQIKKIELQPRFDIIVNGVFCGYYKADFKITGNDDAVTIEDVKGMKTTVYQLKKKLIEAIYKIKIIEI